MCAEPRVGRGVCGPSPGAPRVSLLQTHLDTVSAAVGRKQKAWVEPGSMHAWTFSPSQLGTWVPLTKDAPRRGTRSNVTLGEEWSSRLTGQHAVFLPSGKTGASTGYVCAYACHVRSSPSGWCPTPGMGALSLGTVPHVVAPCPLRLCVEWAASSGSQGTSWVSLQSGSQLLTIQSTAF